MGPSHVCAKICPSLVRVSDTIRNQSGNITALLFPTGPHLALFQLSVTLGLLAKQHPFFESQLENTDRKRSTSPPRPKELCPATLPGGHRLNLLSRNWVRYWQMSQGARLCSPKDTYFAFPFPCGVLRFLSHAWVGSMFHIPPPSFFKKTIFTTPKVVYFFWFN